jgi:hypothetical protein
MIESDSKAKQLKKFSKIDEQWRSEQLSKNAPDLFQVITRVAINTVELDLAKDEDEDLARLQEELKVAREPYTLGRKENNLKIQYLVQVLKDRGVDVDGIRGLVKKAVKNAFTKTPVEVVDEGKA